MTTLANKSYRRWVVGMGMVAAAVAALVVGTPAAVRAADPKTSLELVPAHAHIYGANFRCREQIEIVAKSNWWAKLKAMPAAQMGWAKVTELWNSPLGPGAQVTEWLADPENKDLIDLALELASDEFFVYADKQTIDLLDMYTQVNNAMTMANFGSMILSAKDAGDPAKAKQFYIKMLSEPVAKNLDKIAVPEIVIGFRTKSKDRADKHVKRLTAMLKAEVNKRSPDVAGRIQEKQIAGSTFTVFEVDGELVPWSELPLAEFGEAEDLAKKIIDRCKKLKASIAVGHHRGYLLVSIGESTTHLASLGQGKLLAEREEFAPLKKLAGKPLTSVGYASREASDVGGYRKRDIDQMAESIKHVVELAVEDAALMTEIRKDIDELAKDIKRSMPEPGAKFSVSWLTDRGYEGYEYNYGENLHLDATKPLSILNHVGGSPLLMIAGRGKPSIEGYDTLVKWLKKGHGYFERFAVPEFDAEEKAMYDLVMKKAVPLLVRIDKANRTMLIPALAEGQEAFVLDAKLASKQWIDKLPATAAELKLLQPAIVMGATDADRFKKGMDEYQAVFNAAMREFHEFSPDDFPLIQLPNPKPQDVKGGTVFAYPFPKEWGVDPRIAPSYGISAGFVALGFSPVHVGELLAESTPRFAGPLADTKRPLAAAVYVDFAGMIDVIEPWVTAGMQTYLTLRLAEAGGRGDAKGGVKLVNFQDGDDEMKLIMDTIRQSAELLKAFRGYTGATYVEGKALVTHGEIRFQDVAK